MIGAPRAKTEHPGIQGPALELPGPDGAPGIQGADRSTKETLEHQEYKVETEHQVQLGQDGSDGTKYWTADGQLIFKYTLELTWASALQIAK